MNQSTAPLSENTINNTINANEKVSHLTIRKNLDTLSIGIISVCSVLWGLQGVMVKLVDDAMSPVTQLAFRSGGSALCVFLLLMFYHLSGRQRLILRRQWLWPGLLVGLLFAGEFFFVGEALRRTSVAHVSVCLYTSPIFTALGMHFIHHHERLNKTQWLGVVLAFSGIAVAFLLPELWSSSPYAIDATQGLSTIVVGDLLGVLAGLSWASTTLAVRATALSEAPPEYTLLFQLIAGSVILGAASLMMGQAQWSATPALIGSLAFQIVIVSFASYLAWYWLLRHYLATRISVFSFLTPIFAIVFGILILNEKVDFPFFIGVVFVFAGIILVNFSQLIIKQK